MAHNYFLVNGGGRSLLTPSFFPGLGSQQSAQPNLLLPAQVQALHPASLPLSSQPGGGLPPPSLLSQGHHVLITPTVEEVNLVLLGRIEKRLLSVDVSLVLVG